MLRRFRTQLVICALALLVPLEAEAQLGRLRRAAEARANRATEAPARAVDPTRSSMDQDSEAARLALRTLTPLDFDSSPMPPAIVMESVMRSLWILPTTGDLKLETVSVAFPPSRDVDGDPVDYSEQMRFHVRMRDAGGDLMMDRYYVPSGTGNPVVTLFQVTGGPVNRRNIARLDENEPLVVTTPGTYTLEFLLDDRVFWEMPFEVMRLESDDPYSQSGPRYFLRGAWQEYGYLGFGDLYSRAERDTKLYWYAFTQLEDPDHTRATLSLSVQLYRGDQLLAQGHVQTVDVKNEKQLMAWPLRPAGAREDIRKEDLTDDAYAIHYTLGDSRRVFPFEVRGGEIVPQGRQVREGTDPLHFIEGINESWWLTAR